MSYGKLYSLMESGPYKLEDLPASNILLYHDGNDDVWVAHALEFDLVETSIGKIDAILGLLKVIFGELDECRQDGHNPFRPAPEEYWKMYLRATPISLLAEIRRSCPDLPPNFVIREIADGHQIPHA